MFLRKYGTIIAAKANIKEVTMKKIILVMITLVLLVSTAGVFAACSNVNQLNMLSIGWLDKESYTYDVVYNEQVIGEMTYTFKRVLNGKESTPAGEYEISSGGYCEYSLNITGGEYAGSTIYSKVILSSTLTPIASYKKYDSSNDALDYEVTTDYRSKKGSILINGKEHTFKKSASTFDNDSLYTVIRASVFSPEKNNYSLSMSVVSNDTAEVRTISVAKISAEADKKSKLLDDKSKQIEFKCSTFRIAVPAKYGDGTFTYMSFANDAYKFEGKSLIKLPVEIIEGDYTYVLKGINLE